MQENVKNLQTKLYGWWGEAKILRGKVSQSKAGTPAEIEQEIGSLEAQIREIELPLQEMLQSGELDEAKIKEVIEPAEAKLAEDFEAVKIRFW